MICFVIIFNLYFEVFSNSLVNILASSLMSLYLYLFNIEF